MFPLMFHANLIIFDNGIETSFQPPLSLRNFLVNNTNIDFHLNLISSISFYLHAKFGVKKIIFKKIEYFYRGKFFF